MAVIDSPRFGFQLVSPNGDTLGTVESRDPYVQTGDAVVLDGAGYRVRSVIPIERIAEVIDSPLHGVLEVEPL